MGDGSCGLQVLSYADVTCCFRFILAPRPFVSFVSDHGVAKKITVIFSSRSATLHETYFSLQSTILVRNADVHRQVESDRWIEEEKEDIFASHRILCSESVTPVSSHSC
jgi:hypothetical protein